MKKINVLALALFFMIIIFSGCNNLPENDEVNSENIIDYEPIYLDYIKENANLFSRGIILSDLNDDKVPELFSIAYDVNGDLLYYHELKDGAVTVPDDNTVKTYIDPGSQIRPATFFERPGDFFGVYKNKLTGQKAIINSIADGSEKDKLDIITFEDRKLVLIDEGVKAAVENRWNIWKKRDTVMCNYELLDGELYSTFLLSGDLGEDCYEMLKALISEFKSTKAEVKYAEAKDGNFYSYIRNINTTKGEIELIPVKEISYDEFKKAIDGDRLVTINGEEMSVKTDDIYEYKELCIAHLYAKPWFDYQFSVPTEEKPLSIIEGYMGNTPIKVKMSKNLKVRYGVLGYNEDDTVSGYETLGRNQEYKISEYLPYYAEFGMGSYYRATVKNGELVYLDVLYHE